MKKVIYRRIGAAIALIFSLLTIVEGSQVLFGTVQPDHFVLKPLLIYNVLMGIVGIIAGVVIWINCKRALLLTTIITFLHFIVLFTVEFIFYFRGSVAEHSVVAMIIRVAIWLVVLVLVWRNMPKSDLKSKNENINIDEEISEN
ncbi:MAG: hypothetical protein M0P71_11745 [Melioribacteraceae bacterium]|nr:hypothetical protein [Melioribacteraceae bacterium]